MIISISEGGPLCPLCSRRGAGKYLVTTGGAIAVMRRWQSSSLYHINRFVLSDHVKSEVKEILDTYISYVTGREAMDVEGYLT